MIQLNEGICYSPEPNEAYRCNEHIKGGGLAAFFGDDLQMWNLAWLTDPNWDLCLNVKPPQEALISPSEIDAIIASRGDLKPAIASLKAELQGLNATISSLANMKALDPDLAGLVKRALTMDDDIEDWGTPPLRDLLMLPPRAFMLAFSKKDIMCLELTATYGTPLIQTMWSRARLSQPATTDVEEAMFNERAMGNVIPLAKRQNDDELKDRAARIAVAVSSKPMIAAPGVKTVAFELIESNGEKALPVPVELDLPTDVLGEAAPYQTANNQFIDNGNGTVTDTTTGLTWMRCALGQVWDGTTCTGEAGAHRFNRAMALQITFADYSDWRVPNIDELESIVAPNRTSPAINTDAFPNTPYEGRFLRPAFWSSSVSTRVPDRRNIVFFDNGGVSFSEMDDSHHVRLVRGEVFVAKNGLFDSGEASVSTKQVMTPSASDQQSDITSAVKTLMKRIDRMERRFDASVERIEKAIESLPTEERIEKAVKTLSSGQLAAMSHIKKWVDLRVDDSIRLITTVLTELRQLGVHELPSQHGLASPSGTVSSPTSISTIMAWSILQPC